MIKLYGGARSRASIVKWYLEELQAPHEFQLLDMQVGQHLQPEFLAINPFGKVPAIADGDFLLWESGAILLYLADKYAEVKTLEERAIASQWVLFANATLGPGLFGEENRAKETPRLLGGHQQDSWKSILYLRRQFHSLRCGSCCNSRLCDFVYQNILRGLSCDRCLHETD